MSSSLGANQKAKLQRLRGLLAAMHGAVVAYSGGVDSTLLLAVASDALPGRVMAVTASSATYPADEVSAAVETATGLGLPVTVIETDELSDESFTTNPPERCYHCKRELFRRLVEIAGERGYDAVLDGSNKDDLDDERPGMRAAEEAGVRSPLIEAELTKEDIREISRHLGLTTADKPSMACLASRFPYGTELTRERLEQVGRAEQALRDLGFGQLRVRYHGPLARIEVEPAEIGQAIAKRAQITRRLKEAGFVYVALDLDGYRSGSANEVPRDSHPRPAHSPGPPRRQQ